MRVHVKKTNRSIDGFTLIELMIVLVIIAIIAAIAYPSYRNSVIKSDRSDAMVALTQAAQAMERCYAENHDYTNNDCTFDAANADARPSPQGYYKVVATLLTKTSYTLTATAKANGPQADDTHCQTFNLSSTGVKTATHDNCWQK